MPLSATRRSRHGVAFVAALAVTLGFVVADAGAAHAVDSGSISGTVTLGADVPTTSMDRVRVIGVSTDGLHVNTAVDPGTGVWVLSGLPAGAYTIQFVEAIPSPGPSTAPTFTAEYYNDVYSEHGAQPVMLGANEAVTGIDATLELARHFTSAPTPVITYVSLKAGSTLGVAGGTWAPAPTFAVRWYRNGVAIPGATATHYDVTPSDRGKDITLTVTASLGGYTSVSRTSAAVHIPLVFTKTITPTISYSGTAKAGTVMTAHRGTWTPATTSNSYQWNIGGVPIPGATHSTYTVTAAARGQYLTVTVIGNKSGYLPTAKTSAAIYVPKIFSKKVTPTITGTAKSGHTLTAHRGTWSPKPAYTYRWYRNGVAVSGATHSTYKLTSKDKGKKITVKVTGKRSGYTTVTKTSVSKTIAR